MKGGFVIQSGQYLLANPLYATFAVFATVALTVLHVPLIWLAMIVTGLLVLARGPKQQGQLLLAIGLPILLAWFNGHGLYQLHETVLVVMTVVLASLL